MSGIEESIGFLQLCGAEKGRGAKLVSGPQTLSKRIYCGSVEVSRVYFFHVIIYIHYVISLTKYTSKV
jgi:hypothetical protein